MSPPFAAPLSADLLVSFSDRRSLASSSSTSRSFIAFVALYFSFLLFAHYSFVYLSILLFTPRLFARLIASVSLCFSNGPAARPSARCAPPVFSSPSVSPFSSPHPNLCLS